MKASRWILVIILLLLVGVGGWFWWRSRQPGNGSGDPVSALKPTLSVAVVTIDDINPDRIKMTVKSFLKNPLPLELKTHRLQYAILIDSVNVLESTSSKPITIRSSDSSEIELPMELFTKRFERVLKHFEATKADSANYTLIATIYADVPIAGEKEFHFTQTKRMPALRIPKVKIEKVNLGKLGLKESTLNVTMTVSNPNLFPLKLAPARYEVLVDKDLRVNGTIPGMTTIPARGSAPLPIHMDIRTGNVGHLAWKALFDKKDTPFKFDFHSKLVTDNAMMKNSKMAMTVTGTLADLKK